MSETTQIRFYPTNVLKFSVLSVATFGVYLLYWFYKCWKYVKLKEEKISPLGRALFAPLWTYALCMRIFDGKYKAWSVIIFLSYFGSQYLWRLPDPYWLLSILAFVPILPLVIETNALNAQALPATYTRFGWKHILVSLFGVFLVSLVTLSALNIVPSTHVITGDKLWASDVAFLKEIDALPGDEKILYFYSWGGVSKKIGGTFFTDKRAVAYRQDLPFWGPLIVETAEYKDIADIHTQFSTGMFEDTEIRIIRTDGSWFLVPVSSEGGRDRTFLEELTWIWRRETGRPQPQGRRCPPGFSC